MPGGEILSAHLFAAAFHASTAVAPRRQSVLKLRRGVFSAPRRFLT
jgi:hypothetical protein